MLTAASVALLLVAIGGWFGLEILERRIVVRSWIGTGCRAGLVLLALAAHLNLFDLKPNGALNLRIPAPHLHDTYHYHLGPRYFAELGHARLYHAVILADVEDDPDDFDPNARMRDLADNRVVPRGSALDRAREIRASFSPERWAAFKRDVAAYRQRNTPERWQQAVQDNGYNGTPLVSAWLGFVIDQFPGSTESFLRFAWMFDVALIALLSAVIWSRAGGVSALAFLFFFFANPLNDASFIGGSFLRYSYFVALAGAFLALQRDRLTVGGSLLAVAGWLRIFPLAIYGGLLLRDLATRDWRARLRAGRALHVAFVVASLLILGGTSLLDAPDGRNPWSVFAERIRVHGSAVGVNQVFIAAPLSYWSAQQRSKEAYGSAASEQIGSERADRPTGDELLGPRREHVWLIRGITLVLLGLAFAALRRADRKEAVVPCLLGVFCVLPMTHYYWAVLSLLPLLMPHDLFLRRALLILFAAFALTSVRSVYAERFELLYALLSLQLLGFLVVYCLRLLRGVSGPLPAAVPE